EEAVKEAEELLEVVQDMDLSDNQLIDIIENDSKSDKIFEKESSEFKGFNGEYGGIGCVTADLPQGNDLAGVKQHRALYGYRTCKVSNNQLTDSNFNYIEHI
ncbi:33375_t:CDS:2, partial [Racocetra persica]